MIWTQQRNPWWPGGAVLLSTSAAAMAATAAFLFDPGGGRRRRALIRDRLDHVRHATSDILARTKHDLRQRRRGFLHDTRARRNTELVDDPVLMARVRSRLGRVCSHPHAIRVDAREGTVRLSGPIAKREARRLVREIAGVRGVEAIEDALERHDRTTGVPALQGGRRREWRVEFFQEHWSPTARAAALGAGGMALGAGLRRRGPGGWSLATAGALLCARGISDVPAKRIVGLRAGRHAVRVQKDINIHAPPNEVFSFFCNLEAFPRVMDHLRNVEVAGGHSRWKVAGPAGIPVRWEAKVTAFVQDERIAWQSIPGSRTPNAGTIHFQSLDDGRRTRVEIRMSYTPPGGFLGHAVARLLGKDPRRAMDRDLLRVKSLLETGAATAHGHTVSKNEVLPTHLPSWGKGGEESVPSPS